MHLQVKRRLKVDAGSQGSTLLLPSLILVVGQGCAWWMESGGWQAGTARQLGGLGGRRAGSYAFAERWEMGACLARALANLHTSNYVDVQHLQFTHRCWCVPVFVGSNMVGSRWHALC
jgi:hypothetical protein